jgi:hypothetical protein
MTSTTAAQSPATPAGSHEGGCLPRPLPLLLATARREIDWHTDDHGLCAACGSAYPCERAILADLALSGL